jgi:7-cyano-7-deazaguanine reductase
MPTQPSKHLETFPNPHPGRDYIIEIEAPEFTCLCPKTGQPDFATLSLEYVPERLCVELKSLKLYIWSYRNEGHFHEDVTNRILNDLVAAIEPRFLRLKAKFYVRGGIYTTVTVEHRKPGWSPAAPIPPNLPREVAELPAREMPEAGAAEPSAAAESKTAAAGQRFRMLQRTGRAEPMPEEAPTAPSKPTAPPAPAPTARAARPEPIYLGIDLGTSGCRIVAVNGKGEIAAHAETPLPPSARKDEQITQDPTRWWKAVVDALQNLLKEINPQTVRALAVDGTSGTLLLTDAQGNPVTPALMYNDQRAREQAERIAQVAEANSGAQGASSGLAKLLWLQDKGLDQRATHALHQADWISGRLSGAFGHSDHNNCLKLGFDVERMKWPDWFAALKVNGALLPQVHAPGEVLGKVSSEIAAQFGFAPDTQVLAGTTDGVAAFLAAGIHQPGQAVTALGTTLVLKLLSVRPLFSPEHGVYSHRLGKYWLAGGASNSGGSALLQYFKLEQMREMTPLLDPETFTGLDYYPLPDVGERFPINDPHMVPRLEPLPANTVTFFQGMLEGIARIEAMGYQLLAQLGGPNLKEVRTTGGGAQNPAWLRIRERTLAVPVKRIAAEAAYGAALLAAGVITKTYQ